MLHSDGLPYRVLRQLEAAGRAMTTAEVARGLGCTCKAAATACGKLEQEHEAFSRWGTSPDTKRPMRCWVVARSRGAHLWEPVDAVRRAAAEQARREAQAMAHGAYPGRDIRYQLPADWEPPSGGFRAAGIGRDGITGKPWERTA